MNPRIPTVLAWSIWMFSVAFSVAGLIFLFLNGNIEHLLEESLGVDAAVGIAFPMVGAVIASRQPGNTVGWIFCVIGLSGGAAVFFAEYSIHALVTSPGSLPVGLAAAWIGTWIWVPSVALTATFLLLLFPYGRLLSPRWRSVAWLAAGATAVGIAVIAVTPWEALEPGVPGENPFGIEAFRAVLRVLGPIALGLWSVSALLSLFSLFVRFYRSRGVERQQLKWFVYAGVLTILTFLPEPGTSLADVTPVLQLLFVPLLPLAAGVAILRYRLYDIDLIINRTLVYGSLTVMLVAVYVGSIVVLQGLLRVFTGQESTLAVVASTLAIAAVFNPLRTRIQAFIDRRFYRRKYDARKTLETFSARLRDETDLEALRDDLVGVVTETMQPAHVSLWLRPNTARQRNSGLGATLTTSPRAAEGSRCTVGESPGLVRRATPSPQPTPLPQERPVGVLAGEGEAAVAEAEQPALLVVDEGGITPALLSALHLEVVEEPGADLAKVGLGAAHDHAMARIVFGCAKTAT